MAVTIVWLRRDLRLTDHPALLAAAARGAVVPVFIRDFAMDEVGAAARMRWGMSLAALADDLAAVGSRLLLRSGPALEVLRELVSETGADAVYWSRLYDPAAVERDIRVKSGLKGDGIVAKSFGGHVLFEPWDVETQAGGPYRVYTPFWKAVKDRDVPEARATPSELCAPDVWPAGEDLDGWALGAAMRRGGDVLRKYAVVGQGAASQRLATFIRHRVDGYKADRDRVDMEATSGLSENLTYGEISPYQCWAAGVAARDGGKAGAEHFLKELVWREFAYHLLHHFPTLPEENFREGWDDFPWNGDADSDVVMAWKQGRTGVPFVDAAMREMYVTGRMHNRARMIVASYLTKHLLCHWRIGMDWFADCLSDWDPASNAMGWQWVAGSGPDAAPYFRVFNPDTQAEKFDPMGAYRRAWIAEGQGAPPDTALDYFAAVPRVWGLSAQDEYPDPVVGLAEGRDRALAAYKARND